MIIIIYSSIVVIYYTYNNYTMLKILSLHVGHKRAFIKYIYNVNLCILYDSLIHKLVLIVLSSVTVRIKCEHQVSLESVTESTVATAWYNYGNYLHGILLVQSAIRVYCMYIKY